jgi:hypothetical protein
LRFDVIIAGERAFPWMLDQRYGCASFVVRHDVLGLASHFYPSASAWEMAAEPPALWQVPELAASWYLQFTKLESSGCK